MTDLARNVQIEGEAARALLANIRDVIGDDEEMVETAIEGETGLKEAITDAVDRIAELNAHCEALGTLRSQLESRQARLARQAERIKAAVHVAMGHAELRKLELPGATLSIRAVPPKLEVTSESEIPSRFWKTPEPKLDKKAVLDALKNNEAVPGAVLSNGGETLAIKGG